MECNDCKKIFQEQKKLNRHIREVHSMTTSNFECLICQKNFKRGSHLKRHELLHSENPKPFICHCGANFSDKYHLSRHEKLIHSFGIQCEICGQSFTKKKNLFRHQFDNHNKQKPYKCNYCNRGFYKEGDMIKH